jgi:uncharacterized protein (DUF1778 family)
MLIRCGVEEAAQIRNLARNENRTISGYVLNIMERALRIEDKLATHMSGYRTFNRTLARTPLRVPGPRTAILVRCYVDQADRIRAAAARRDTTVSAFVLHSLRTAWNVAQGRPTPPL